VSATKYSRDYKLKTTPSGIVVACLQFGKIAICRWCGNGRISFAAQTREKILYDMAIKLLVSKVGLALLKKL